MKLYTLNYSAKCMVGNGDSQAICLNNREFIQLFSSDTFPEIKESLKFQLHKSAKLTNCLSQNSIASKGLLINDVAKKIFDKFNLNAHKFYSIELITSKGDMIKDKYYWLQLEKNHWEEIDYLKSIFYQTNGISKIGEIQMDSFSFYESQKKEKGWKFGVEIKEAYLKKESVLRGKDMFKIFPFEYNILISQKLKDAIEETNLTGFEIDEYSKIIID